jgi:electron transport complex protein RnfE
MAKSAVQEFTKGLWAEIPPFRLVLGLCPVLAVTKGVETGIFMGIATTFVLVCSNVIVSLLRKVIPKGVRIACFIVVIATFVTVAELLMQAFAYSVFMKLGIFMPLIVVNCIILGRAEALASKKGVGVSFADGLGMGIGFTLSLFSLASIREIIGNGTFYEIPVFGESFQPFTFMIEAPGAFVSLGLMLCIMNLLGKK